VIGKLRDLFSKEKESKFQAPAHDRVHFAAAVLLVEMAQADHEKKESEMTEIHNQLVSYFNLTDKESQLLLADAEDAVEHSVSLHDFTRTLHNEMSYKEKEAVIEMLWRIALADKSLDKYEDYLIGKIAELLYVSRGDVIRLKHDVLKSKSLDR